MHFRKEIGEHTMRTTTRLKILITLAGIFFLVYSNNLLAWHESDFDGEELLVGTYLEVTLETIKWEGLFR